MFGGNKDFRRHLEQSAEINSVKSESIRSHEMSDGTGRHKKRMSSKKDSIGYFPKNANNYLYFFYEFLCLIVVILSLSVNIFINCGTNCYKYSITLLVIALFAILLLELNRKDLFINFTQYFYSSYNGKLRKYTLGSLTTICGLLLFCVLMSHWTLFSYYCAQNPYIHSFLYLTIVGYILLSICRSLRPPPPKDIMKNDPFTWSWHIYHPIPKIISNVMIILFVIELLLVGMGAFLLIAFSEAAAASSGLKTWGAVLLYSILALLMGITPLAPSTPVDACGGFLLLQIFVIDEGWSIYKSWAIALALVAVLHFIGSCLQYFIGKAACVQHWANANLPPDLLAASDSVLREANWFTVGMVGQVFMDTANGLNQGRMDMAFCTQFWSEYASMPSAVGWVTTGAVLAIPGLTTDNESKYDWASQAVPICIMVASLWQMIGSTLGANALASSTKTTSYWTNREKWETVQYFSKVGVQVTKDGWDKDVFGLTKLFDKINPIHSKYVRISSDASNGVEERIYAKQYNLQLEVIRESHYRSLNISYLNCEKKFEGQLLQGDISEGESISYWNENPSTIKRVFEVMLVVLAIITGLFAYNGIAAPISTSSAVQNGVKVLDFTDYVSWGCLTAFIIIYLIYYWKEFIHSIKSAGSTIAGTFKCSYCRLDNRWETVFDIKHLKWEPSDELLRSEEITIVEGGLNIVTGDNIAPPVPQFSQKISNGSKNKSKIKSKNEIVNEIMEEKDEYSYDDNATVVENEGRDGGGMGSGGMKIEIISENNIELSNNTSNNSNELENSTDRRVIVDVQSMQSLRKKSNREMMTPSIKPFKANIKKKPKVKEQSYGFEEPTFITPIVSATHSKNNSSIELNQRYSKRESTRL